MDIGFFVFDLAILRLDDAESTAEAIRLYQYSIIRQDRYLEAMEPLVLKTRQPEDAIECWDDDEDLQGEEFHFRPASLASISSDATAQMSHHRDSISSRFSRRSDLESSVCGDEEQQVVLPNDDEMSKVNAIASAINAGIPIPTNVPSSALIGGTIKRLGGKRSRKVVRDDWSEDLVLDGIDDGGLKIKKHDGSEFPDAIQRLGTDPEHQGREKRHGETFAARMESQKLQYRDSKLYKFQDNSNGECDFFADELDVPTIKVAKHRSPQNTVKTIASTLSTSEDTTAEDFERDIVFPSNSEPLKLPVRQEIPRTPASNHDDFDEWTEGSLGTRYGGTRRDGRSNRSSSISGMSPSVASSLTMESEDEGLDGLVLPEGPLDFGGILKRRKQNEPPDPTDYSGEQQAAKRASAKEDFFSGIEIGDGDVFDSGKLTQNRNIKHKATRPTSPTRRTAMTITFTNKTQSSSSKIQKPPSGHERTPSALEPVSEGGGPVTRTRRPHSRLAGHSTQSSSNMPAPPMPPPAQAMSSHTPSRQKPLSMRPSMRTLRPEPTTTSAQLLKMKRSMPTMRSGQPSPPKTTSYHRPPSRTDSQNGSSRTTTYRPPSRTDGQSGKTKPAPYHRPPSRTDGQCGIPARPKTPTDRYSTESSLAQARKHPVPFLPAGSSQSQSHHVSVKTSRHFRRHDSESSNTSETTSHSHHSTFRSASRSAGQIPLRSPSPKRKDPTTNTTLDSLARDAASKRTLIRPRKPRNFGDGSELEGFDDLPTSERAENKYIKQPTGRGAPKSLRSKLGHVERSETPTTSLSPSISVRVQQTPTKLDFTPRFARDTNASRIAREQRTGLSTTSLAPVNTNWKAQVAARGMASPPSRRKKRHGQEKPHLIKPLGDTHNNPKSIKGMTYNPLTYRWDGNENAITPFDSAALSNNSPRGGESGKTETPRPALITNVNATNGVQVVGGMVFDPQRMCWLPMAPEEGNEDSDDPFADVPDLDDGMKRDVISTTTAAGSSSYGSVTGGVSTGDWCVGEEFDVGPEFIKRQREEEERWRRKVEAWVVRGRDEGDESWRWSIRDLAAGV
ncbi:hypothetical protein GP486_003737 [Trichoglossum hirsutum]|uniref:Cytokinesis inhibitor byr4 n=1 Tax=Trichoglossum hirsutum TaxID=265104 RepID=A0A9P8LCP0_9PEZI|nr:hypothetical protein GP486_003737 [Trichoglossum hirsutum]